MELMLVGCRHVEDEDARGPPRADTEVPRGEVSKATASSWRFREEKVCDLGRNRARTPNSPAPRHALRGHRAGPKFPPTLQSLPRASGHSTRASSTHLPQLRPPPSTISTSFLLAAPPPASRAGREPDQPERDRRLRDTLLGDAADAEGLRHLRGWSRRAGPSSAFRRSLRSSKRPVSRLAPSGRRRMPSSSWTIAAPCCSLQVSWMS